MINPFIIHIRITVRLTLALAFTGLATQCNNYSLLDKLENPGTSSSTSKETFTNNNYIFVSSWTTLGHMGGSPYNSECSASTGADKADCACTRAAIARGLRRNSTHVFRAWLSIGPSTSDARCRVQGLGNGCTTNFPTPWFNTSGQMVAGSFDNIVNSTLSAAVRYDEFGVDQGPNLVWTNTSSTGFSAGAVDCADWTDGVTGTGAIGNRTVTGATWTADTPDQTCNTSQRIYCVAAP